MFSNDGPKEGKSGGHSPLEGDLGALRVPLGEPGLPTDHESTACTLNQRDGLADFLSSDRTSFDPHCPEICLLRECLDFSSFVLRETQPELEARGVPSELDEQFSRIIQIKTEQLRRAFVSFAEGASMSVVAKEILGQELFPSACKPLCDEFLKYMLGRLATLEFCRDLAIEKNGATADSLPPPAHFRPSWQPELRQTNLETISKALRCVSKKIVADFLSYSDEPAAVDAKFDLLAASERNINHTAFRRHLQGVMIDPHEIGLRVFDDAAWAALALFFTGYSADAVAAATLLHANNSLGHDGEKWLSKTSADFSDAVKSVLQAVRSPNPHSILTMHALSPLNCQRPLEIVVGGSESVAREARAIAAVSLLSPAYETNTADLLDVIPFLRESDTPPQFIHLFKGRCGALGRSACTRYGLPVSDAARGRQEIQGTLDVLRRFLWDYRKSAGDSNAFRSCHHANDLALRVISEKGSLKSICAGLIHPSFNPAHGEDMRSKKNWMKEHVAKKEAFKTEFRRHIPTAKITMVDVETTVRLEAASAPEADQIIHEISASAASQISDEHRQRRWQSGILTSLDFRTAPESERYESASAKLAPEGSGASRDCRSLGEFIASNREDIIRRVEEKLKNRLLQKANRLEGLQEDLDRLLADKDDDSTRIPSYRNPAFPKEPKGINYFIREIQLLSGDLRTILVRLEDCLSSNAATLVGNEEECIKKVCAFIHSEGARLLTRWNARDEWKALALTLDLTPARAIRKSATKALYTAEERGNFSLASRKMMEALQKIGATGTKRDPVEGYRHSLETGMTLALCGAPADVVIAGILHDLYELTAWSDRATKQQQPALPKVREDVKETFGASVDELIGIVSEVRITPDGEEPPFLERKMAIFEEVKQAYKTDPVLARKAVTVLMAAKVSTLTEGLFEVEEKGDSQPWSKGDYLDNLQVMFATRSLARELCDENVITELFDHLCLRWMAAADNTSSRFHLGMELLTGEGRVTQDHRAGFELLLNAAKDGEWKALLQVGLCYLHGRGVPQSSAQAAKFFNYSLTGRYGNWHSRTNDRSDISDGRDEYTLLKELYKRAEDEGLASEREEVRELLVAAADQGDAGATYQLGLCHLHGWGVSKNPSLARDHFIEAAALLKHVEQAREHTFLNLTALADLDSLFCKILLELGKMHESGAGEVAQDHERALTYYLTAAVRAPENHVDEFDLVSALARMYHKVPEGKDTRLNFKLFQHCCRRKEALERAVRQFYGV